MRDSATLVLALLVALVLGGCPSKRPHPDPVSGGDAATAFTAQVATDPGPSANAAHGKELILKYECNRCHDGTGQEAAVQAKHCVHCHKDIIEGRFNATPAALVKWKPRVKELTDVPSLEAVGKRFGRAWVEGYLLQPADLRPHLEETMPRLAITVADARDISAYLVPDRDPPVDLAKAPELAGADLGKGRHVLETKGCGNCHVFTGVVALPASTPPTMTPNDFVIGNRLAPDLKVTRDRMTPKKLVAWISDPGAVKSDTKMPKIPLSPAELRDVAAYIMTAELTLPPKPAPRARLPLLTRKVLYKEVDDKVFHRTCWHCHSEPDYAIGDGGPGNSGGFGFKPRGLNLSAYDGIAAGYVDDHDERQSVFAKDAEGVPRLVRALLARADEEQRNAPSGAVRGMPLGYDPLSPEDIQLVDTWVAQGRPR